MLLDLAKHGDDFVRYLLAVGKSGTEEEIRHRLKENSLLFCNRFDDIWWMELNYINYLYGDLLEQIFRWVQGPLVLTQKEQIPMNGVGENDIHLVSFSADCLKENQHNLHKSFRKFNTKSTAKFLKLKYWICEDAKLAKELGIETPGDIYMLREAETPFNNKKANIDICDFPFTSERLVTSQELSEDLEKSWTKIMKQCLDQPIIIHEFSQFEELRFRYGSNVLVVYCDPKKHGVKVYKQLL